MNQPPSKALLIATVAFGVVMIVGAVVALSSGSIDRTTAIIAVVTGVAACSATLSFLAVRSARPDVTDGTGTYDRPRIRFSLTRTLIEASAGVALAMTAAAFDLGTGRFVAVMAAGAMVVVAIEIAISSRNTTSGD